MSSLQQQRHILDQELNSNNLTRITTKITKPKMSLFRALSQSIYFDQDHVDDILRILKLCLICSCKHSPTNPFPPAHRKAKFLAKFINSLESIEMYNESPDSNCFIYDNLQLASLAYQRRVILFTVSNDLYLQENLYTACNTKVKEPPIMIAKIGSRFYCVQSQSMRSVMMFIRETIVNQMINLEAQCSPPQKNNVNLFNSVGYNYQYDQMSPTLNQNLNHKKSLSDCGDILSLSIEGENVTEHTFYYPQQQEEAQHSHSIQSYEQGQMDEFYYQNNFPNMQHEPRLERTNSINITPNQRYTGRLKFFDQNGNYGFIIVDAYNCDLFVHYDDLQKTGIPKQKFLNIRNSQQIRFEFTCLQYDGKYKKSKKAVDLLII